MIRVLASLFLAAAAITGCAARESEASLGELSDGGLLNSGGGGSRNHGTGGATTGSGGSPCGMYTYPSVVEQGEGCTPRDVDVTLPGMPFRSCSPGSICASSAGGGGCIQPYYSVSVCANYQGRWLWRQTTGFSMNPTSGAPGPDDQCQAPADECRVPRPGTTRFSYDATLGCRPSCSSDPLRTFESLRDCRAVCRGRDGEVPDAATAASNDGGADAEVPRDR